MRRPMSERLATAPRAAAAALCLLALLAGCGSSDKLIPQSSASAMLDDLAQVRSLSDQGECAKAATQASQLSDKVAELPSSVDSALAQRLRSGVRHLQDVIRTDCQTQPAVTDTGPTETTTTPPTTTTTTPTTTTPPTETTPPTTTTTPTTTTPPPQTTPGDGGGSPAPGGTVTTP
jgi:hypothetical protein